MFKIGTGMLNKKSDPTVTGDKHDRLSTLGTNIHLRGVALTLRLIIRLSSAVDAQFARLYFNEVLTTNFR